MLRGILGVEIIAQVICPVVSHGHHYGGFSNGGLQARPPKAMILLIIMGTPERVPMILGNTPVWEHTYLASMSCCSISGLEQTCATSGA